MKSDEVRAIARKYVEVAGVPANLAAVARYLGVRIIVRDDLPFAVSGWTIRNPFPSLSFAFVVVLNKHRHYYHRRFTLAHEFWHVLNGQNRISFRWSYPQKNSILSTLPAGMESDPSFLQEEREANIFATELLMPEKAIRTLYETGHRSIRELSRYLRVSTTAIRIRLFSELKFLESEFFL